jgi:hypothetical protein
VSELPPPIPPTDRPTPVRPPAGHALRRVSTRRLAALGAATALACLAMSAPASAAVLASPLITGILTYGGSANNVVTGDLVSAPASSVVKVTLGSTLITCPAAVVSLQMTDLTNPPTGGTAPATLSGDSWTFATGACTGYPPLTGISLASPAAVDLSGSTLVFTSLTFKVALQTSIGPLTCGYGLTSGTADAGLWSNAGSSVTFTTMPLSLVSGSSVCPVAFTLTGTFGTVIDASRSAPNNIVVN